MPELLFFPVLLASWAGYFRLETVHVGRTLVRYFPLAILKPSGFGAHIAASANDWTPCSVTLPCWEVEFKTVSSLYWRGCMDLPVLEAVVQAVDAGGAMLVTDTEQLLPVQFNRYSVCSDIS